MKILQRLRDMAANYPAEHIAVERRSEADIIADLTKAKDTGNFYAFCYYQVEYKATTGHYYKD